jgi:hypothetical protein
MQPEPQANQKIWTHSAFRPVLLGVFSFLLLNLLFTLGVTFSSLNQRFNFKYGNFLPVKLQMLQANHPEKTNVVFLGTSQTNNGFIPSVFDKKFGHGVKSFNVGLPNNHYDIMLAYLRFHQQRFGKPQMLMLEVSPSIQEKDAGLYYLPALYYRTLIERQPALASTFLANPLLAQNVKEELLGSAFSSLHQYRYTFSPINLLGKVSGKLKGLSGLHDATANAEEPLLTDSAAVSEDSPPSWVTDDMLAGGWYPKSQSVHMKTPAGLRQSVVEARKYYIDPQKSVQFEKLEALLSYCQSEGIPVTLVTWPNHPAFVKAFQQSRLHQPYQEGLARVRKQYPVMMVNLNHHLPKSQTSEHAGFFADPRHLTPEGARLFSEKLASILNGD